jgi:hypothetical protein
MRPHTMKKMTTSARRIPTMKAATFAFGLVGSKKL